MIVHDRSPKRVGMGQRFGHRCGCGETQGECAGSTLGRGAGGGASVQGLFGTRALELTNVICEVDRLTRGFYLYRY